MKDFARKVFTVQTKSRSGPVWNGRQIRNAFQSAMALAVSYANDEETISLDLKRFERFSEVSDKFSSYIWQVRQENGDADWNRMEMIRWDDFVYMPINLNGTRATETPGNAPSGFNGQFPQTGGLFDQFLAQQHDQADAWKLSLLPF